MADLLGKLGENKCGGDVTPEQLKSLYERFLTETDPSLKHEAGRELIRVLFGKDSIWGEESFGT